MKVTVIGTGYVGLVQGVCLAELGNEVVCVDIDKAKIEKLEKGISPIYEPGIEELILQNIKAKRLSFTTNLSSAVKNSEIIFIAVGTPPDEDGRADLKYVLAAAEQIGKSLDGYQIIVNKSTVPIGTGENVKKVISEVYKGKFDVVSNPEFLREGSAISDFMKPDRVVLGVNGSREAANKVAKLYEVLECPILITDLETAEMIKYASNSFLATQISFINALSRICERVGSNVDEVAAGMKLDGRIGPRAFLSAGIGYGGSCFPKDVAALITIAQDNDIDFSILEEVEQTNQQQRRFFIQKTEKLLGDLTGKKLAIWGLAFKPKTDDIREAPSLTIVSELLKRGAELVAYDPVAEENFSQHYPEVKYASTPQAACKDADGLLILTEWDEFKQIDLKSLKSTFKNPVIIDGRNVYRPDEVKHLGYAYDCFGKKIS